MTRQLWHILRAIYYMIKKGISVQSLLMDLHHLLKCGKIAGKAIGNLLAFHHHDAGGGAGQSIVSTLSCRSMDPNLAFYTPREVEFSCSNTPAYPFHVTKRKHRHHHHHRRHRGCSDKLYDAATVARLFEILNTNISDDWSMTPSPSASPAAPVSFYGKTSPAAVRQLRVTDSPFPIMEEEGEVDGRVDKEAEEFIQRFYEQLVLQQRVAATPDTSSHARRTLAGGRRESGGWSG